MRKRRRAVTAAILLRDACLGGKPSPQLYCCATRAWGGSAQSASSRATVDGHGVWSVYPQCCVYAAAEGFGAGGAVPVAELRPWSKGT